MKKKRIYTLLLTLLFAGNCANAAETKPASTTQKTETKQTEQAKPTFDEKLRPLLPKGANELLFTDGKGYFSYRINRTVELPSDGRVLIQFFYNYDCKECVAADDHLKAYAAQHSDKVVLNRTVGVFRNNLFSAKMDAAFQELGRPDLSDLYLFDNQYRKLDKNLATNGQEIGRWLVAHGLNVKEFEQLYQSEQVKKRVEETTALYKKYRPPVEPIAILNGKYILTASTLNNDDFTFAVLDFLIAKLNKEKAE